MKFKIVINKKSKDLLICGLLFVLLSGNFVYAQEDSSTESGQDAAIQLQQDEAQKAEEAKKLREELQKLENELQQINSQVNAHKQEADSYGRDISILEGEIRADEIKIQRNRLIVNQTDFAIQQNRETIDLLEQKAKKQRELLGKLILSIYKLDDTTSLEIILTSNSMSEFFNDINNIKTLQESLNDTLDKIKEIKKDIEIEQVALEQKSEGQLKLIQVQQLEQAELEQKADYKEVLLRESRSREYTFREIAQEKQRTIAEVRNQLFVLEGAGVATSFGEAYEYAKTASNLTGVRPAFLLAVLKRESSWGQNVGLCYLVNTATGQGKGKNTGTIYNRVMKPSRDVEPFLAITTELGLDPFSTPVSCPHPNYGYGGAMGPAQFIPSTWMGYKDRVSAILGRSANPWLIQDAFIASAVKLADAGAASQNYAAERKAALIYYAGGGWNNPLYWAYTDARGVGIMDLATTYQSDIDILEGR